MKPELQDLTHPPRLQQLLEATGVASGMEADSAEGIAAARMEVKAQLARSEGMGPDEAESYLLQVEQAAGALAGFFEDPSTAPTSRQVAQRLVATRLDNPRAVEPDGRADLYGL